MGRLQDASALVHSGIRATRGGQESNFICSPISILLAFFIAMRGAGDPTLLEMHTFIGTDKLPPLPPPPLAPPAHGGSLDQTSSSGDDSDSDAKGGHAKLKRLWNRFTGMMKSDARAQVEASNGAQKLWGLTDSTGTICRVGARLYVDPETASTEAFGLYMDDVQSTTSRRAETGVLDFCKGRKAEEEVNSYVAKLTEGHVSQLLSPGSISPYTRVLAVSVAFFKSKWRTVFDKHHTEKKPFYALKGPKPGKTSGAGEGAAEVAKPSAYLPEPVLQQVLTMFVHIEKPPFYVHTTEDYLAVGLPYENPHYVMFIIMPQDSTKLPLLTVPPSKRLEMGFKDTKFPYVEQIIEDMKTTATKLKNAEIHVRLPKFHLKAEDNRVDLADMFAKKLDVTTPFAPGVANFEKINGGLEELYIDLFVHASEIECDESGTVASGATAISLVPLCYSPPPEHSFTIVIDKPFYYDIRYLQRTPTEAAEDEDSDADTSGTAETEASAAGAAATPTHVEEAENGDLVLFSGQIADAAAAQS